MCMLTFYGLGYMLDISHGKCLIYVSEILCIYDYGFNGLEVYSYNSYTLLVNLLYSGKVW